MINAIIIKQSPDMNERSAIVKKYMLKNAKSDAVLNEVATVALMAHVRAIASPMCNFRLR